MQPMASPGASEVMESRRRNATVFLHALSAFRIVVVAPIVALILDGGRVGTVVATALFAVAAATDFVDGRLARRWGQTSLLGSFLDTTADKLLVTGAIVALVDVDRASSWVALIIVGRELVVMGLRGLAAIDGDTIMPSMWGKLKANVQFAAILVAMAHVDTKLGPQTIAEWALWAAAAITLASGIDYGVKYFAGVARSQ
jgi:CDP-diacylglycerol--glycerol-3-phosphate 3-phosphatidyltransferase